MNTLRILAPLICLLSLSASYSASRTTPAPTCPDYSNQRAACYRLDEDCCDADSLCEWNQQDEGCGTENYVNRGCCERVDHSSNTTRYASPSPTTPNPTTSTTTSTSSTSSSTSTTSTSSSPSTSTTTSTSTTSSTSDEGSYPTPKPTLHSAMKWEMIHPQYEGSDGELLWNIYYGDFGDDERFDGFRKNGLWDANVIRPILMMDEAKLSNKQNKVMARESQISTPSSTAMRFNNYVVWLVLSGVVLAVALAVWIEYKRKDSKYQKIEGEALVSHAKDTECYVC